MARYCDCGRALPHVTNVPDLIHNLLKVMNGQREIPIATFQP